MDEVREALTLGQSEVRILVLTLVAMLLGAAIGFEREVADKPAGLRTNALVSGASCMLVSLGRLLLQEFDETLPASVLRVEPFRVIEAVVTGVSFLGAGTIIRGQGPHIEGLTTAAAILCCAAVGMTVASGHVMLALLLSALVVAALRVPTRFVHEVGDSRQPADQRKRQDADDERPRRP
jgi:putative Mg2+ transporter-C (MgtC) family protein